VFNCYLPKVVFQEVPDEISLAFTITGCSLGCKGCHSPDIWDPSKGFPLSAKTYVNYLEKYQQLVTCILFFGGEWQSKQLVECLIAAKSYGFKTCLYTGELAVNQQISQYLDYIKLGPWNASLGGLASKKTNQRFYDLNNGECLNHRFQI